MGCIPAFINVISLQNYLVNTANNAMDFSFKFEWLNTQEETSSNETFIDMNVP